MRHLSFSILFIFLISTQVCLGRGFKRHHRQYIEHSNYTIEVDHRTVLDPAIYEDKANAGSYAWVRVQEKYRTKPNTGRTREGVYLIGKTEELFIVFDSVDNFKNTNLMEFSDKTYIDDSNETKYYRSFTILLDHEKEKLESELIILTNALEEKSRSGEGKYIETLSLKKRDNQYDDSHLNQDREKELWMSLSKQILANPSIVHLDLGYTNVPESAIESVFSILLGQVKYLNLFQTQMTEKTLEAFYEKLLEFKTENKTLALKEIIGSFSAISASPFPTRLFEGEENYLKGTEKLKDCKRLFPQVKIVFPIEHHYGPNFGMWMTASDERENREKIYQSYKEIELDPLQKTDEL